MATTLLSPTALPINRTRQPAPEAPAPDRVLAEMLRGYRPLEEVVAGLRLSWRQRLFTRLMVVAVHVYRLFVLPFRRRALRDLHAELEALRGQRIRTLGAAQNHFPESERAAFERDGMLGPFRVMAPEEVEALTDEIRAGFATGFDGKTVLGDPLKSVLQKHGAWTNQMAGMYQALRMPALREVLRRPPVAERLAGILGDEVMCWRTQFFEKAPGAEGTFWHQTSTFRESSTAAKLMPTEPMDDAIVQLTVWMALTDVTIENGALRMVPGSFTDGRIEHLYYFAMDNLMLFLAMLPTARLATYLAVAKFSTGNFIRSQAVLEAALDLLDESPFVGREVRDLAMRAGECVIFTSLNMHASHPNSTADATRLSFVARCAANHVLAEQHAYEHPTPEGTVSAPLPEVTCFQVHGTDSYGLNHVMND
ncbi:MAG: phytanoyl-CoA dioxygenase family protein [Myxococcales bacterium]|nr:phytanoyl-CoA dioxygenase family protein [Myxococcales bacterium]